MAVTTGSPQGLDTFTRFCRSLTTVEVEPLELHEFQQRMLRDFFEGCTETLILIPKKNGKGLSLVEQCPTENGWIAVGDLKIGDTLFDERGKPCRVTYITETMYDHPSYRVEFSDGTHVIADDVHLWEVGELDRKGPQIRSTQQIKDRLRRRSDGAARFSIPVAGPLDLPDVDLPIDAYTLGVWLAEGDTKTGHVTFGDVEVRHEVEQIGWALGGDLSEPEKNCETRTVLGLRTALRKAGILGDKHIPQQYLRASIKQRTALAQGLLDGDGHITPKGQIEFVTVKPKIRDGMLELLRSLGFKPTLVTDRARLNGLDYGERYRIQFWAFADRPMFRLKRKRDRQKQHPGKTVRSQTRQIIDVVPVPSVPMRCLRVDSPSHLFLVGEGMVPTHNTTLLAALALFHLLTTPDAEAYIAATTRDQATILYNQAKGFVERSLALQERISVKGGYRQLRCPSLDGKLTVLAADADTADGVIPTLALVDELHRQRTGDMYGVLRDGLGPRNGQMVTISTAGDDEDGTLGRLRRKAYELPIERKGRYSYVRSPDGDFVMHEHALQPDDDRSDLNLVKMVNPAPWHTRKKLLQRMQSPSMTDWQWARFACGVWLQGEDTVVSPVEWSQCGGDPGHPEAHHTPRIGLDVSFTIDTTALVPHWLDDEGVAHLGRPIILVPPEGRSLKKKQVLDAADELREEYGCQEIVLDPEAGGRVIADDFEENGFEVVAHSQKTGPMAAASEKFHAAIRERKLVHPNDRLLTRHVLNGRSRNTDDGRWRFVKENTNSKKHIDGLIAAAIVHAYATDEDGPIPMVGWG